MENFYLTTKKILGLLGIPHTSNFLGDVLDSHPEPESLLSISDALAKYKVDTLAVQIGADKLDQLPLPCVVQIKGDHHRYFSCLSWVSEDSVEYLDIKGATDWYLSEEKGYAVFAAKYPLNGELKRQESNIKAMQAWGEFV